MIRWFGTRGKLFNVHFRNIKGRKLDFMEAFPDEGDMDMARSLRVYQRGWLSGHCSSARALVGGQVTDTAVWGEARRRQDEALGRLRFVPGDLRNVLSTLVEAVVRPSAGIAYVPERIGGVPPAAARRVQRALRERFDPAGVLA